MLEQNIDTMTLQISPFILRHHKSVFAARQNLTHGLAVGVCWQSLRLVTVVLFGNKLPAYVDTDFVNSLIIHLLHMETVINHMGVVEHLRRYQHNRRR